MVNLVYHFTHRWYLTFCNSLKCLIIFLQLEYILKTTLVFHKAMVNLVLLFNH